MDLLSQIGGRLRAALIMALLVGIVLIDSVSRIISMCADGFLIVLLMLLIWPMIKSKEPPVAK